MSSPRDEIVSSLRTAVREYAEGRGEHALERAYEIGREALVRGVGLIELATAHQTVLDESIATAPTLAEATSAAQRAGEVFRESLTAYEMAQRGYLEANQSLKVANDALGARARELDADRQTIRQQRDALLRIQQQKDQLTAFIIHDLKNPLSGILLNAKVLTRDPEVPDEQRGTAQSIVGSAQSMNRMVMNLLDISRSEDGALTPKRTELDLKKVLDDVANAAQSRFGELQRRVVAKTEGLAVTLNADPDLLRRVLENLVDNALRYAPAQSTVWLEGRQVDQDVEIRVRDEGKGIPVEDRTRVFDKYVQLDPLESSNIRTGRGLGLLFCRLAVEAHGGRIWVEGGNPKGAVFCFSLPRQG